MNIAIIEVYPNKVMDKQKAIDAHLRNSIVLSEYLKADLLCVEADFLRALKKKYDVLVLGYASGYAPFTLIRKLVDNNKDAVKFVISNEYNIVPSLGGFRPFHMIAGYADCNNVGRNSLLSFTQLNVNLLLAGEANKLIEKKYDCVYYGTFRERRKQYFQRYLHDDVYLSTSDKNFKKFKHIGCTARFIRKLSWAQSKETLNRFRYSLYLEDDYSNQNFTNLANRYYEAQRCNCVTFFDRNCVNTIRQSELQYFEDEVRQYFVKDYADLQNKIAHCNKDFDRHLQIQQRWNADVKEHRTALLQSIRRIIEEKHAEAQKSLAENQSVRH